MDLALKILVYKDNHSVNTATLTWVVATIAIRLLAVSKAERNTILNVTKQIFDFGCKTNRSEPKIPLVATRQHTLAIPTNNARQKIRHQHTSPQFLEDSILLLWKFKSSNPDVKIESGCVDEIWRHRRGHSGIQSQPGIFDISANPVFVRKIEIYVGIVFNNNNTVHLLLIYIAKDTCDQHVRATTATTIWSRGTIYL